MRVKVNIKFIIISLCELARISFNVSDKLFVFNFEYISLLYVIILNIKFSSLINLFKNLCLNLNLFLSIIPSLKLYLNLINIKKS